MAKKTLRRLDVQHAVKQLRDRLAITQDQLADMVGSTISGMTISRWELGKLMPQPKNCRKLAEIAEKQGWWEIACALNPNMSFDDWLLSFKNKEDSWQKYQHCMALSMCAFNLQMFEPGGSPSYEDVTIFSKMQLLLATGYELLWHLKKRYEARQELMTVPPTAQFRQFWWDLLERDWTPPPFPVRYHFETKTEDDEAKNPSGAKFR